MATILDKDLSEENAKHRFNFMAVISDTKLQTMDNIGLLEEMKKKDRFRIEDIKIPSPNNPAKTINAKLLTYHK